MAVRAWHNYQDVLALSRKRLPRLFYEFVEGGGYDEGTLARNRSDFDDLLIRHKVMVDVGKVDMTTELLGHACALPLILAPIGLGGMVSRRGEAQAARAAAAAKIPLCLSTFALCGVEEIMAATGRPPWLQLYMLEDESETFDLLDRAAALGVDVLAVTVDVAVGSVRHREARRPILAQPDLSQRIGRIWDGITHPGWLYDVYLRGRPHDFGNFPKGRSPATAATPKRIERVRERWEGKMLIKGVLEAGQAKIAADFGADGVIVSNHGGRQLDSVASTISALPAVAEAVGGTMTVLMDGGVRSGLDVFKALAAGADGCLVGRAWVHAAAAGGERGVAAMIDRISRELSSVMTLAGRDSIAAIDRTALARA
jgi:L-lactate dehydrogenase (cytochrome)